MFSKTNEVSIGNLVVTLANGVPKYVIKLADLIAADDLTYIISTGLFITVQLAGD